MYVLLPIFLSMVEQPTIML